MTHSHAHHGHAHHEGPYDEEFLLLNKKFYLDEEEYDWVAVTDKITGLESFFHRGRERLRDVADPEADQACVGMRGLVVLHPPRDLAEEVAALERQVVVVDSGHRVLLSRICRRLDQQSPPGSRQ